MVTTQDQRPEAAVSGAYRSLDDHVALHLLMERRAEVGAVVGEHAALLRRERDRLRFARIDHEVDVVVEQAEAVELVGRLLDVRVTRVARCDSGRVLT